MPDSSHQGTIITAVITVIGTIVVALFANWDKIFPPSPPLQLDLVPTKSPQTEWRLPAEPMPNIGGAWRDSNYPSNGSNIIQYGSSFQFTRWGVLPNGIRFESSGDGTITGQRVTSTYNARYESGATSMGDCSGTVSPDGMRMELNCRDSLLGAFGGAAVRK